MKAIKRNLENLEKVANSIVSIPFSTGPFEIDYFLATSNSIRLVSPHRDGIGCSILREIPSNYKFRISFVDDTLYLKIWFD